MILIGILCGLIAALGSSGSYLSTRNYVQKRTGNPNASTDMLLMSHVWMGLFGVLILPFSVGGNFVIPWSRVIGPQALNLVGYIAGQFALMFALKHAEASRVGPLLTSKLIVSSVLVMIFGQPIGHMARYLTGPQWVAVGLCVLAGLSINFTGGRMKSRAILAVAVAAVGFSISDWGINLALKAATPGDAFDLRAALFTASFAYGSLGLIALPFLLKAGRQSAKNWRDAAPFGICWFVGVCGLFVAFGIVGILLGTILQCTRGFLTILLASALMYRGHHHIEPHAPRPVIVRRLGAGVLMFVGIVMYRMAAPASVATTPPPATVVPALAPAPADQ